jgi:hypothetical protein
MALMIEKEEVKVVKGVYLEPSIVKKLKKHAKKERRSLSGQMSFIISEWVREREAQG